MVPQHRCCVAERTCTTIVLDLKSYDRARSPTVRSPRLAFDFRSLGLTVGQEAVFSPGCDGKALGSTGLVFAKGNLYERIGSLM